MITKRFYIRTINYHWYEKNKLFLPVWLKLPFQAAPTIQVGYKTIAISKYDCQIFPKTQ